MSGILPFGAVRSNANWAQERTRVSRHRAVIKTRMAMLVRVDDRNSVNAQLFATEIYLPQMCSAKLYSIFYTNISTRRAPCGPIQGVSEVGDIYVFIYL